MNLTELLTQWIGKEEATLPNDSWNEWEQGKYQGLKDLKSKIPDLIEQIEREVEKAYQRGKEEGLLSKEE